MPGIDRRDVCRFWSKDYISGISALIGCIDNDIDRLEKEADFYKWFIDDWSKKLLQSLGKAAQDTELVEHEALCDLLIDLKRSLNVEELEGQCLGPLQATIKGRREVRQEVEQQLRSFYTNYTKDLKAVKDSFDLYNRKASASPFVESKLSKPTQTGIVLDDHLSFTNSNELQSFLERVRQSMPVQKKGFMNYLGVEGKNSFQGKVMLDAIKRNTEKLDTSPYNLDRLGQKMLDLKLIEEDSIAIGGKHLFTQEGYFQWPQLSKDPTANNSLTSWFKGLPIGSVKDVGIDELEGRYFAKCCKLEYSRFELEKAIYQVYQSHFQNSAQEIDRHLVNNRKTFNKLFKRDKSSEDMIENPIPVVHYFTRDSSTHIIKWEFEQDRLVRREMMFGCPAIDEDTICAIRLILNHIRDFNDEKDLDAKIAKSWTTGSVVDMNRAISLKMDLIKVFKDVNNATNTKAVETIIRSNHYTAVDDWICLIKLWLLEIPGSLVPPICCDLIKKNHDWTDKVPLNNLKVLIEICSHLQSIEMLITQSENPIYHYFIRPADCLRNFTKDYNIFEPWALSLPTTIGSLQQAYDNRRQEEQLQISQPAPKTTPSILIRSIEEPTTPPRLDETFIPRPFRTVSAASSTPGSPVPSRASKRISGLVIELPGSPTTTTES